MPIGAREGGGPRFAATPEDLAETWVLPSRKGVAETYGQ
jgi:hypothetical protein